MLDLEPMNGEELFEMGMCPACGAPLEEGNCVDCNWRYEDSQSKADYDLEQYESMRNSGEIEKRSRRYHD